MNVILQALLVHVVFLASIFDIYFKSPIVRGIEPNATTRYAPAKRLVLFVADGLRSEAFYKACENLDSPFLKFIVETRGTWGISHTRVPTETRPGHVAIIAGLYEDPSAVARGWKENPVEFDTVFNQSRFTWSWGSPDILPMFAKGASGDHVFMDMYGSELEDFSGKESTIHLDTWVFNKVSNFIKSAQNNPELLKKLHSDKIIFFLHLLGLDTAGHTHKPGSKEYKENIKAVDEGVKKMEELFESFYNHDGKTSYIFTADHGMTDWGSHGAGDPSETETPLIAWGAGINTPQLVTGTETKLDTLRKDVHQADIAPLMAALIGISLPVNSVGLIPKEYLNFSSSDLSQAMFANAQQMLAQYKMRRQSVETGTLSFLYRPFAPLTKDKENEFLDEINKNIVEKNFENVILLSENLVALSLSGLDYYQNYYQILLLMCMTLAYLGWIAKLLCALVGESKFLNNKLPNAPRVKTSYKKTALFTAVRNWFFKGSPKVNSIFVLLISMTLVLIQVQSLPSQFYVYCCLPQILWWDVFQDIDILVNVLNHAKQYCDAKYGILLVFAYIIGIEILVLSFFHRFVLSFGMLGILCWPLYIKGQSSGNRGLIMVWCVSSIFLAVFPMLPVIGSQPQNEILLLSGVLWVLFGVCSTFYFKSHSEKSTRNFVYLFLLLLLTATVWNIHHISSSLGEKTGLPVFNQAISWLLFSVSIFQPLLSSQNVVPRIVSIMLGLAVPFLLLSASHEGLFLLTLSVNMLCWLCLENAVSHQHEQLLQCTFLDYSVNRKNSAAVSSGDFRRAFIFLFYIVLSFFGTGNIASLNSFDPTWVRCFVTVFSPFLMTALILWKTVIPFLTVACTFRAINVVLMVSTEKLFFIVMIFSDAMGMHFLHLVTNQGSWLEIGTSISHFVIVETMTLLVVVLYGAAQWLTRTSLWQLLWQDTASPVKPSYSLESGVLPIHKVDTRKMHSLFQAKKHAE
ncbi:GPI ethanolamine phosphate transferase 1 isoform X1 [Schistocerca nitens]|uniref:GPI ethanolamine phosphate transferase 1 isoform X1 n=2 Tax=Schistocerca nitens TaxID=7011 RepID=UPI00211975C4|nr:GPI ethanolamine phosphate transferase 1 isoform X1 [Schistocerca nitens]